MRNVISSIKKEREEGQAPSPEIIQELELMNKRWIVTGNWELGISEKWGKNIQFDVLETKLIKCLQQEGSYYAEIKWETEVGY